MKVTNISASTTVYLRDLKLVERDAQSDIRGRGEDRYLKPGQSVYLPNTSSVMRSVVGGDLRGFIDKGILRVEDLVNLAAQGSPGDSVVLTHNLKFPPVVYVLKQVASTWVDGIGTVDVVHNSTFTTVTVSNVTAGALTFLIRLL